MTTLIIRLDAKPEQALDRIAKSSGRTKGDLLTGENVLRELGKALRQNDFRSCPPASFGSFSTRARRFLRVVGL